MSKSKPLQVALIGNPNSGKTSIFNLLTGLKQQVSNFPGVTVEKKTGNFKIDNQNIQVIDLPGTYSLYPRKEDEKITYQILMEDNPEQKLDLVLLIADASNLKRNLLFCSQIIDLNIPLILVLTMNDIAKKNGTKINIEGLSNELHIPIISVNARKNKGLAELHSTIQQFILKQDTSKSQKPFLDIKREMNIPIEEIRNSSYNISDYNWVHYLMNYKTLFINQDLKDYLKKVSDHYSINSIKIQAEEIMLRYKKINQLVKKYIVELTTQDKKLYSDKLDAVFLNRIYGYGILIFVFFILFQSIFWVAKFPQEWIQSAFQKLGLFLTTIMPISWFQDLIVNGVLAGLSGICVFIPQIMILFGLTSILEDTGYMARISFLMDRLLRKVGLNGKSVMPMISGFACAIPAILSSRNIENKKERLLTILITPFMSCSARLPVYTILIALLVQEKIYFGFLSLQGLIMMCFYFFGIIIALIVSFILNKFIHSKEKSFFILELPVYRSPRWKNIGITMVQKASIFVRDAGKVILLISVLLWFLNSYGPKQKMEDLKNKYDQMYVQYPNQKDSLEREYYTEKIEQSYAGIIGKKIEPFIAPLGYDWKIGIAIITSFAAREVFVGTMATLYSIDSKEQTSTLSEKMRLAVNSQGQPIYSVATTMSLLIFYALAMQCMSTMVVVYKELRSIKWMIFQFFLMTGLAYILSFAAYQLLK